MALPGAPLNHPAVVDAQLHREFADAPQEIPKSFAAGHAPPVQVAPAHQTGSEHNGHMEAGAAKAW